MAKIKSKYPRAYEKWSESDNAELRSLSKQGASDYEQQIASQLKRQPSAIRSRLEKFPVL